MDLSTFYGWAGVSSTTLVKANRNNGMMDASMDAWRNLSEWYVGFFIIMILTGVGLAIYYYTSYNNKPNRHYTPKQWCYFLFGTLIVSPIVTWIFACVLQNMVAIEGLNMIIFKIALCNAIYSSFIYFLVSVVWCNFLHTNAYRLFKIS